MTKMQPWGIFMPEETPDELQSLHFDTLTLSQLRLIGSKGGQRCR
jgi:hypothetical protein